jgi:hypothetical protein
VDSQSDKNKTFKTIKPKLIIDRGYSYLLQVGLIINVIGWLGTIGQG